MLRSQQYSIAMIRTIAPGWFNGADPSGRQKPMEFDAGYANIECSIAFKIASDRAM
jgi:hypothetical protein